MNTTNKIQNQEEIEFLQMIETQDKLIECQREEQEMVLKRQTGGLPVLCNRINTLAQELEKQQISLQSKLPPKPKPKAPAPKRPQAPKPSVSGSGPARQAPPRKSPSRKTAPRRQGAKPVPRQPAKPRQPKGEGVPTEGPKPGDSGTDSWL